MEDEAQLSRASGVGSPQPGSCLVIAPNWIGDAVLSLPFLRALRRAHPADRLAVVAPARPAAIYRAEGSADTVFTRSSLARDAARLRREGFSEAWLLPNSFRAALLAFLSGVPQRIGYATDRRGALLTRSLPPPPPVGHQLRDYDLLLRSEGIEPDPGPPRLQVPERAARRARQALETAGVPSEAGPVLLCPASAFARTKRWPVERYGALAAALLGRGLDCAAVVGPGENALGRRVGESAGAPVPVVGVELDPVELAAVLAQARAVVANDSGPMHLAAAVGTPVVALFGPTDPGRTSPAGAPSRVLDRYVFCSPCFKTECPYGHECMKEIAVEDVLHAVEELLS